MMNMNLRKPAGWMFAVILTVAFVLSSMPLGVSQAYAADEPQAEATGQAPEEPTAAEKTAPPSQEPSAVDDTAPPSEEPPLAAESQPSVMMKAAEEPGIVTEADGTQYARDEVIVKFKSAVSDSAIMSTLDAADSEVQESLPGDDLVIAGVPEGQTVDSFIDMLSAQPDVEFAQPNYIYHIEKTVNDPYLSYQWHLNKINAFGAWDITMGSPDVRVAVLDTGIDNTHPEFSGQIVAQEDVVNFDGNAQDDSGRYDCFGHGTHVAGIIAGKADNGEGIAGVAPGVKLITVDVFDGDGAYTSDIILGIQFALNNGASIINMSLGGAGDDPAFHAALDNANARGVLCVAAAGNEHTSAPSYPSDYDSVVSVIATDQTDAKPYFSNYGDAKDISAPGVYIASTYPGDDYYFKDGTSMASPVVAGVAALILSADPHLLPADIKNILYSTADDLGAPGKDATFGYGRVNAYNALVYATTPNYQVSVTTLLNGVPSTNCGTIMGAGSYRSGSSANLQAWRSGGYRFVRWLENGTEVSTSPFYTVPVTRDISLSAEFTTLTPLSISGSKTDVSRYGGSDGTITAAASGGDGLTYVYCLNNSGSWRESPVFTGLTVGTYTISVKDMAFDENTASCTVAIGQPPTMGIVPANKMSTKPNAGTAITIVPPAPPRGYTLQSVSFTSSNPSVTAVDASGNVTFLAGGKATIITKIVSQTVDKKGRVKTKTTTVKKTIIVQQPVSSISLNLGDTTIARTQKVKLVSFVAPATASNKKLTWKSSNPKIAAVSSSGVVTGKAGGTAIITCMAKDGSGAAASCTVNVTPIYPTGLKMSKTVLTVKLGKTAALKATIAPKTTDFKTVTWVSSNPAVATVDAKGKVRAAAPGTAVITATTSNGYAVSCTVTVP